MTAKGKKNSLLFLMLTLLTHVIANIFLFDGGITFLIGMSFFIGTLIWLFCGKLSETGSSKNNAWLPVLLFTAPYLTYFLCNLLFDKENSLQIVFFTGTFIQIYCLIGTYIYLPRFSKAKLAYKADELLLIAVINVIVVFFLLLINFGQRINFGFDERLFFSSCSVVMLFTLSRLYWFWYLEVNGSKPVNPAIESEQNNSVTEVYRSSGLNEVQMALIAEKLLSLISEEQVYLDANLDLKKISIKCGIPKHHISQTLNIYLGKSFYRLLAEHRILHAKNVFKNSKHIKVESLAYSCGFNSVSSFYRYFKEVSGTTPAAYIIELEDVSRTA
jgi:AraC-like DNA-binding protein